MRLSRLAQLSLLAALLAACTGAIDGAPRPGTTPAGGPGSGLPGAGQFPPGTAPQGAGGPIHPGRVVAHRLNKVEYDNTLRDLLGVDLGLSRKLGFPDDNYVEGFDNNAESLTAPPLLVEKYQLAAATAVAAVLDTAAANAAVRAKVMLCDPAIAGAQACATQVLTAFATRAFRRPVTAAEIAPYMGLLATATMLGDGFEQAINAALQAMLLSPKFLFRTEANPGPGIVAPLGDYELASRLSYFLWSSMPDAELLQKASDQSLRRPDEIARQVARMLQDPKASSFVDNLAGEWLASRELAVKEITLPGAELDDALRSAMGGEASLFLREIMTGNHAIAELLGANFAFVNRRLATHYGLPEASSLGDGLQRIALTDNRRMGGILTQANFLTVNSQRDRTSPTRRGKWISENLLCVVIPPPPPKIPELVPNDQVMPTSTRERLEAHRRKGTTCNGCHQFMDPLGLAFEHYDVVGRYRDTDLGAAIDASGAVPTTDVPFDGAASLATALENDKRFANCVVQKLFTYALGRGLRVNAQPGDPIDDGSGLADVQAQLLAGGNRLSLLVQLIAQSPLMTMRVGE
jgi:hypothetical protein